MVSPMRLTFALCGVLLLGVPQVNVAGCCGCCRVYAVPAPVVAPAYYAVQAPVAAAQAAPAAGMSMKEPGNLVAQNAVAPRIQANLAKLPEADRKLAEAQKWCAIENDHPLGSTGVPVKVMVKDQPVFLCCKGCTREAQQNPDKTLAKVQELKARAAEKR